MKLLQALQTLSFVLAGTCVLAFLIMVCYYKINPAAIFAIAFAVFMTAGFILQTCIYSKSLKS